MRNGVAIKTSNYDRDNVDYDPYPTSFVSPYTYIWDNPAGVLSPGSDWFLVSTVEGGRLVSSGFTATRNIDQPILVQDVNNIQTVSFTLRLEEELSPEINAFQVWLGNFGTFEMFQDIVEETLLSQNQVSGWTKEGDGIWSANLNELSIGVDYQFEIQIRCDKKPEYYGRTIYNYPQVVCFIMEEYSLSTSTGTSTTITHPEGETALFRLNEPVTWKRNLNLNSRYHFIDTVSIPVDNTGLTIDGIEFYYGRNYDHAGQYLGHSLDNSAYGDNIVSAETQCPAGIIWPISYIEEGEVELCCFELFSEADLALLGITSGIYEYVFHDHLGNTIETSINSIDVENKVPIQIPNIISPVHNDEGVKLDLLVSWEPVWDPNVNTVVVDLKTIREDWNAEIWLASDQNMVLIPDIPPCSTIRCEVYFVHGESGTTAEGIEELIGYYNAQTIYFTVGSYESDFTGCDGVDFKDFSIIASAWLAEAGDANWNQACDISDPNDNVIDIKDLDVLCGNWLAGK